MPDVIEAASSGRSKCRACERTIGKGELRFGEAYANPYAEGEALRWYHLDCAALRLPERVGPFYEEQAPEAERARLLVVIEEGKRHPRLTRVAGVERASSGRATCRRCRELIEKGAFRVVLQIWEDGRFAPIGFVHAGCLAGYAEADAEACVVRVGRVARDLDADTREAAFQALRELRPAPKEDEG